MSNNNLHGLYVNLDLKQNLNIYATCKQLDNLNLILTIYDNSVQADLTNYDVRLKAMKSDKIPLIQEHTGVTINNNIVTIVADEQLTTTSGKTLIELQFINKTTGQRKATFNLALMVNPSVLEVNATISTATYTLLQELENKLDQATDFFENIDEAIVANNNLISNIAIANPLNIDLESNIAIGTPLDSSLESNITLGNTLKPELDAKNTLALANIAAMESFGDVTVLSQDVTTLKAEVTTARGASANLDARLDGFDTSLSERVKKTTAAITYYVNASTGSDTNDGLTSGTAFKTIQHAIDILPQFVNHNIIINVASGSYQGFNIVGFDGKGTITIIGGDSTNYTGTIFNTASNITSCNCKILISYCRINKVTLTILACSNVSLNYFHIDGNNSDGLVVRKSYVDYRNSAVWDKTYSGISVIQGHLFLDVISGSGNNIGILCAEGGTVAKYNVTINATILESILSGGVIR